MTEEKKKIPQLRKKYRTAADVDPNSLTAALHHQELAKEKTEAGGQAQKEKTEAGGQAQES